MSLAGRKEQRRSVRWVALLLLLLLLQVAHLGSWWHRHPKGDLLTLLERQIAPFLILSLVGVVVTLGILSVVSSLGFWSGWLGDLRDPATLFHAPSASAPAACYLVYLDGIHMQQDSHPPRIRHFLQKLEATLPADTVLIRSVEPYVVQARGLPDSRLSGWWWRRLLGYADHHDQPLVQALCQFLVQSYNLIRVGISSDRRYGPIFNYEIALKVATRLEATGFRPGGDARIILLGYSGGAQIAFGISDSLARLCRAGVEIITLCGVFSGNPSLERIHRVTCLRGTADPLAGGLSGLFFPSRSRMWIGSAWNRALHAGRIRTLTIPRMKHAGAAGPFGRPVDQIVSLVADQAADVDGAMGVLPTTSA